MTKYIKVTDYTGAVTPVHSGYHSVNDDFELPFSNKNETFEWVDIEEARAGNPNLFGARSQSKSQEK